MKALFVAALMALVAPQASAASYPITTPCNGSTSGLALIVQRAPTADELAAFVPTMVAGLATTQLVLMSDHITCDGANWNLTESDQIAQPIRH